MTFLTRRTFLKGLGATGAVAVGGVGAHGFVYGRHALELNRVTVPVVGLPPALTGLRIGLVTDVHRSLWVSDEDVAAAVSLMMTAQPDLVVLGGDYVTLADRQYVGPVADALAPLSAPNGIFGILGNHDDDREMPTALTARGVQMLKDARTTIVVKGETLSLIGIRFWTKRVVDLASLVRGAQGMIVLLAHDPRRLTEAQHLNIPLVLSGHTHGGQVVLPIVGAVAAQKFPVVAGLARRGDTTIFVSRGVGTVYVPVRVNCPPEVSMLTLEPA